MFFQQYIIFVHNFYFYCILLDMPFQQYMLLLLYDSSSKNSE